MSKRYLGEMLEEALRLHVEQDNGLICGTDRLKARLKNAVREWIKIEERDYREHDADEAAELLRDLRESLIDG